VTVLPDDGLVRCDWAVGRPGPDFALYRDYHDQEWGRPLHGRVPLFERMSLEAFQSGLSWLIILRKRENFRAAFSGFEASAVAAFGDEDFARLMADAGIVRNRAKINAVIANARAALGHSAAPPSIVMKSRRFNPSPRPHAAESMWEPTPALRSPISSLRGNRTAVRDCGGTRQASHEPDDRLAAWLRFSWRLPGDSLQPPPP